jgi:hypothetical protein
MKTGSRGWNTLGLNKHAEELDKESETVDTKDIRWKVMTKGCESKGTNFRARGGWHTLIAVFSVSPEKQLETTRLQTRIAGFVSGSALCTQLRRRS